MVIVSFCPSSAIVNFKVRYYGQREIFLLFCGIKYPQRKLFIDLRKAFDTVDQPSLISKLPLYGIMHAEERWFQNYLMQRSQIVFFGGELSKEEKITYGLAQGSILGPLLFNSHQRLPIIYRNCRTMMYADDTGLLFSDKSKAEINKAINHYANLLHTLLCNRSHSELKSGKN